MNTATAQAQQHVTASLLAAAWRENLHNIRQHAQQHGDTLTITLPNATITATISHQAFNQITIHGSIAYNGTPITDPSKLLKQLSPQPPAHVLDEINDAVDGLSTALENTHHTTHITQLAHQHHANTTIALAGSLQKQPGFLPCRFYEPLATRGHHLHPMARTRLGWTTTDRRTYDLETHKPTQLRVLAADHDLVTATPDPHGNNLDQLLSKDIPELTKKLGNTHHLIPVHPWQYQHVLRTRHADAFATGALHDTGATIAAFPTSSIRTLVTHSGTYLKCSLDIQITSTRRGITPATAHNGPILTPVLEKIIATDPALTTRIAIVPEHAGISLKPTHPHPRDLSCILRGTLTDTIQKHEHPIPATALAAISPISGQPVLLELVRQYADATHTTVPRAVTDFLRIYVDRLATAVVILAYKYGVGIEGHLQNCIPTFSNGKPCRILIRDLGGARIHLPKLNAAGYQPRLHPESVTTTGDLNVVHNKISYTVFQNHLSDIVNVLNEHNLIPQEQGWKEIAEVLSTIDTPSDAISPLLTPTVLHKALLTMRLTDEPDYYVPVANPIHRP